MACCLCHFLWRAPGPAFTFLQSSGGITSFFRFLSPLTKQYGSYIIGTVPCERGGTGRRTGFRILRFMHKGSSPFARTIKKGGKRTFRFPPLFCYIQIIGPCFRMLQACHSKHIPGCGLLFHHPLCAGSPACRHRELHCGRWHPSSSGIILPVLHSP